MKINNPSHAVIVNYLQIILYTSVILYFGKVLFIPLFFGLFIAMIMYPVCRWLEMHHWSKPLSITACLLIITIVFAALAALLVWQINVFKKDAPGILNRLGSMIQQIKEWMINTGVIKNDAESDWRTPVIDYAGNILSSIFKTTANTFFILFLTPVYTTLFLYHRKIFVQYLKSIIPARYRHSMDIILPKTINTYFNYIKGMILVYLIVGTLNSIGFVLLGVNNAILFGMLCAVMTIIPYIGIFISALLPITVVWLERDNLWYPLGVVAILSIVQYLEANVIFPKVVGSQLHVSTLAMLIAVIAGGIIWGVAGMVLFIPFVAILKIISDHVDDLKPLNLLLSRS